MFRPHRRRQRVSHKNENKRGTQQARVERDRLEREGERSARAERVASWKQHAEHAEVLRAPVAAEDMENVAAPFGSAPQLTHANDAAPHLIGDAETAEERYANRRHAFVAKYGQAGRVLHRVAWVVHNCVAHPLLGVAPNELTIRMHDKTSDVLNLRARGDASQSPAPQLRRRWAWLVHNAVVHPLIGARPTSRWFRVHDESAEKLHDENWL